MSITGGLRARKAFLLCALLLVGGAGTGAIAFATGELRSQEESSLDALDRATAAAIETLGYEDVETDREADNGKTGCHF